MQKFLNFFPLTVYKSTLSLSENEKNEMIEEVRLMEKKSKNLDYKKISIDVDGKSFEDGFCVNVGNPHIIFFVKDCMNVDLKTLGPKIENHNLFPERTNVTFAEIAENNLIKVNVWERGAGLTKACGTAACATAVAAYKNEFVGNKVDIQFKEGLLKIEIDNENNIFMTGPVSEIKNLELEI